MGYIHTLNKDVLTKYGDAGIEAPLLVKKRLARDVGQWVVGIGITWIALYS